jgi:predicted metal-binding membrane protein
MSASLAEAILRRDRAIVIGGLTGVAALAWAYMVYLAQGMAAMEGGMDMKMAMPSVQIWAATDFIFMFIMWAVMMIAMMTPSAAPMVLAYAGINRRRQGLPSPYLATTLFLVGYLAVWTAFSAVATLAQWGLHSVALLSPMMASTSSVLGGVLLIAAGLFQLTPLKRTCLMHCRSPLGFFMTEWQEGMWGAFRMGLHHGNFCLGCCWLLMALLFVAGVMNLLWVATIAVYVLVEKILPAGHWVSVAFGLLIIGWGVWMLAGTFV